MAFVFWLFAVGMGLLVLGAFVQQIFFPDAGRRVANEIKFGRPAAKQQTQSHASVMNSMMQRRAV